jgi:hypothetical protein
MIRTTHQYDIPKGYSTPQDYWLERNDNSKVQLVITDEMDSVTVTMDAATFSRYGPEFSAISALRMTYEDAEKMRDRLTAILTQNARREQR